MRSQATRATSAPMNGTLSPAVQGPMDRMPARLFAVFAAALAASACGAPPPAAPMATVRAATVEPERAAPDPAPPPPRDVVWTTPADSDECREFARRRAPGHAAFPTREACTEWVGRRRCRPGPSCFDGCNWVTCNPDGMSTTTTLAECRMAINAAITFPPASAGPPAEPDPDWPSILKVLERVLRAPERKIVLVGHVDAAEARSSKWRALALRRAEAVRDALVAQGVPPPRIETRTAGDEREPKARGARRRAVVFELDPDYPLPSDRPDTDRDRRWCGSG